MITRRAAPVGTMDVVSQCAATSERSPLFIVMIVLFAGYVLADSVAAAVAVFKTS